MLSTTNPKLFDDDSSLSSFGVEPFILDLPELGQFYTHSESSGSHHGSILSPLTRNEDAENLVENTFLPDSPLSLFVDAEEEDRLHLCHQLSNEQHERDMQDARLKKCLEYSDDNYLPKSHFPHNPWSGKTKTISNPFNSNSASVSSNASSGSIASGVKVPIGGGGYMMRGSEQNYPSDRSVLNEPKHRKFGPKPSDASSTSVSFPNQPKCQLNRKVLNWTMNSSNEAVDVFDSVSQCGDDYPIDTSYSTICKILHFVQPVAVYQLCKNLANGTWIENGITIYAYLESRGLYKACENPLEIYNFFNNGAKESYNLICFIAQGFRNFSTDKFFEFLPRMIDNCISTFKWAATCTWEALEASITRVFNHLGYGEGKNSSLDPDNVVILESGYYYEEEAGENILPLIQLASGLFVVGSMFGLVSWSTLNKSTSAFIRNLSTVGSLFKTTPDIYGAMKSGTAKVTGFMAAVFGVDYIDPNDKIALEFKRLINYELVMRERMNHLLNPTHEDVETIYFDHGIVTATQQLINTLKINQNTKNSNLTHAVPTVASACTTLQNYIRTRNYLHSAINEKFNPVSVYISGPAGAGKSALMTQLSGMIKQYIDTPLAPYPVTNNNYFDSYVHQPIVNMDELWGVSDSVELTKQMGIYNKMHGVAPYILNMADLSDKGKPFTSEFVISTSNAHWPSQVLQALVTDKVSIDRRMDVHVFVDAPVPGKKPVNITLTSSDINLDGRNIYYCVTEQKSVYLINNIPYYDQFGRLPVQLIKLDDVMELFNVIMPIYNQRRDRHTAYITNQVMNSTKMRAACAEMCLGEEYGVHKYPGKMAKLEPGSNGPFPSVVDPICDDDSIPEVSKGIFNLPQPGHMLTQETQMLVDQLNICRTDKQIPMKIFEKQLSSSDESLTSPNERIKRFLTGRIFQSPPRTRRHSETSKDSFKLNPNAPEFVPKSEIDPALSWRRPIIPRSDPQSSSPDTDPRLNSIYIPPHKKIIPPPPPQDGGLDVVNTQAGSISLDTITKIAILFGEANLGKSTFVTQLALGGKQLHFTIDDACVSTDGNDGDYVIFDDVFNVGNVHRIVDIVMHMCKSPVRVFITMNNNVYNHLMKYVKDEDKISASAFQRRTVQIKFATGWYSYMRNIIRRVDAEHRYTTTVLTVWDGIKRPQNPQMMSLRIAMPEMMRIQKMATPPLQLPPNINRKTADHILTFKVGLLEFSQLSDDDLKASVSDSMIRFGAVAKQLVDPIACDIVKAIRDQIRVDRDNPHLGILKAIKVFNSATNFAPPNNLSIVFEFRDYTMLGYTVKFDGGHVFVLGLEQTTLDRPEFKELLGRVHINTVEVEQMKASIAVAFQTAKYKLIASAIGLGIAGIGLYAVYKMYFGKNSPTPQYDGQKLGNNDNSYTSFLGYKSQGNQVMNASQGKYESKNIQRNAKCHDFDDQYGYVTLGWGKYQGAVIPLKDYLNEDYGNYTQFDSTHPSLQWKSYNQQAAIAAENAYHEQNATYDEQVSVGSGTLDVALVARDNIYRAGGVYVTFFNDRDAVSVNHGCPGDTVRVFRNERYYNGVVYLRFPHRDLCFIHITDVEWPACKNITKHFISKNTDITASTGLFVNRDHNYLFIVNVEGYAKMVPSSDLNKTTSLVRYTPTVSGYNCSPITQPGDCGSPLILNCSSASNIFGFHVGVSNGFSACNFITRDELCSFRIFKEKFYPEMAEPITKDKTVIASPIPDNRILNPESGLSVLPNLPKVILENDDDADMRAAIVDAKHTTLPRNEKRVAHYHQCQICEKIYSHTHTISDLEDELKCAECKYGFFPGSKYGQSNIYPQEVDKITLFDTPDYIFQDTLVIGKTELPTNIASRSKLSATFYKELDTNNDFEIAPLRLGDKRVDPRYVENYNTVSEAISAKWARHESNVDPVILEEATLAFANGIINELKKKGKTLKVFNLTEAINGSTAYEKSKGMEMNASAGYPMTQLFKGRSKKDYFTDTPNTIKHIRADTDHGKFLIKAKNQLLHSLAMGKVTGLVHTVFPKDEILKSTKIPEFGTRSVCCAPLHYVLVDKMYRGALSALLIEYFSIFPMKIGINPCGRDWHELYTWMSHVGTERCFDADYKNYDAHLPAALFKALITLYTTIYEALDPNVTDDDQIIRATLIKHLVNPLIVIDDKVVRINQGFISGSPQTALDNSFNNALIYMYAWRKLSYKYNNGRFLAYPEMLKHIRFSVYGDDNICSISEDVFQWFNPTTFSAIVREDFNMQITDAHKKMDIVCSPLKDLEFLKRSFILMDGEMVGGLAISSIIKMVSYTKIGASQKPDVQMLRYHQGSYVTDPQRLHDLAKCAFEALSLHGEPVYNLYKNKIFKVMRRFYEPPPWSDMFRDVYYGVPDPDVFW
jgi:hypothetical protein